jgi:hypothetical protein
MPEQLSRRHNARTHVISWAQQLAFIEKFEAHDIDPSKTMGWKSSCIFIFEHWLSDSVLCAESAHPLGRALSSVQP